MPDTASPSFETQLGQLAKAYRLLGLTPDDIKVIIDHPEVREEVRRSWQRAIYPPRVRLLRAITGSYKGSVVQSHTDAAEIDFDELLASIEVRYRQVIMLRFGLTDGTTYTVEEVGQNIGQTRERARQIEAKALSMLRRRLQDAELRQLEAQRLREEPIAPEDARGLSIEALLLPNPTANALRRKGIETVGQLILRSPSDLLSITNFGLKSLSAVTDKLSGLGLNLRASALDEPAV